MKKSFILYLIYSLVISASCQNNSKEDIGHTTPDDKPIEYKLDSNKGCLVPTTGSSKLKISSIVGGQKVSLENPISQHIVLIMSSFYSRTSNTQGVKQPTYCTGTLIGPNTVLTAAHCIHPDATSTAVYATTDLLCSSGFSRQLIYSAYSTKTHPKYKPVEKPSDDHPDYDIAVIKFVGTLPTHFKPITLENINLKSLLNSTETNLLLTGFGRTTTLSELPPELRYVYKNSKKIIWNKRNPLNGKMIDLNSQMGLVGMEQIDRQGICNGDSGGPLLLVYPEGYKAVGVASYIEGENTSQLCESSRIYYTLISSYWDWIQSEL